jgi:hypothetical protein
MTHPEVLKCIICHTFTAQNTFTFKCVTELGEWLQDFLHTFCVLTGQRSYRRKHSNINNRANNMFHLKLIWEHEWVTQWTDKFPQTCVYWSLSKSGESDSNCVKKKQFKNNVLTEEKVKYILAWLEISTCKLFRHMAQRTVLTLKSAFIATRLIKFHPYKITYMNEFSILYLWNHCCY